MTDDSCPRFTLDEVLGFAEPAQRLVRFAQLGENPGQGRNFHGKHEANISGAVHGNGALDQ
jgi:hypothetical protein